MSKWGVMSYISVDSKEYCVIAIFDFPIGYLLRESPEDLKIFHFNWHNKKSGKRAVCLN